MLKEEKNKEEVYLKEETLKFVVLCSIVLFLVASLVFFIFNKEEVKETKEVKVEDYLTNIEKIFLNYYYDVHSSTGYEVTMNEIILKRSNSKPYINKVPFCDVVNILKAEENPNRESMQNGRAISKQWEQIHNEPLVKSCQESVLISKASEVNNKESKDFIEIDNELVLSPSKINQLSKLIKSCPSSKSKLYELKGNNNYISLSNYQNVLKIELDCAYKKFNNEL